MATAGGSVSRGAAGIGELAAGNGELAAGNGDLAAGNGDLAAAAGDVAVAAAGRVTPFRFYDNRQKYLAFVNTCNEKSAIARRAAHELSRVHPTPPAIRLFDAGMGDGTVLARLMRSVHRQFPTVPMLVVAKEISLEDVRLGLEKLPDRLFEHPATVFAVTNLTYADAPRLEPRDPPAAAPLNWQELRLAGGSAHDYAEQIEALGPILASGWQTKPSPRTGNPCYVRPSVLVIYRDDHDFLLDAVIPRPGRTSGSYDFILASQPWRARMPAQFKAEKVLAPLARSLAPGGRLLAIQSRGADPGLEIVQKLWPGENPFQVDRHQLLAALEAELGSDARDFRFAALADDESVFRYEMHTLPSEIGDRIGTSTLYAAWNAAIYVNQIEDERLDAVVNTGAYLAATQQVLQSRGGLWFNDETFVVSRPRAGTRGRAARRRFRPPPKSSS
jgi:X-X-X-Leu-X-X-Gly heptad repeat protein